MSKELKALKKIQDSLIAILEIHDIKHPECPDPVKWVRVTSGIDIIESALEVLEIIKKKEVCIYLLNGSDTVKQYNNSIDLFDISKKNRYKYHLSQKEFVLLKKVLLWKLINYYLWVPMD